MERARPPSSNNPKTLVVGVDLGTHCAFSDSMHGYDRPRTWTYHLDDEGGSVMAKCGLLVACLNGYLRELMECGLELQTDVKVFVEQPLRLAVIVDMVTKGGGYSEEACTTARALLGALYGVLWSHGITSIETVDVNAARRKLLGKGVKLPRGEGKDFIFQYCTKVLRWNPQSMDESDSQAIWNFGLSTLNKAYQHQTLPLFAGR